MASKKKSTKKTSDKLRDQERPSVFGYELDRETFTPTRTRLIESKPGEDTGHNGMRDDGMFQMHPSGDIVTYEEMEKRLKRFRRNPEDDYEPRSTRSLMPRSEGRSSNDKRNIYIGVGVAAAVALLGIIIVATRPKATAPKPNLGLSVRPQCAGYTITDLTALRESLRRGLVKASKAGPPDPFRVTSDFLAQKRFGCTSYPAQVRNPGEADLFAAVFYIVTELMVQERLSSESQRQTFNVMVTTWAKSQGANPQPPNSLPTEPSTPAEGSDESLA
jgi:hypothetical protein